MCFAPQRRALFHVSSGQLAPHPRFSEPTFRPSGATNHWKNTVNRDFPIFSRIYLFFLLIVSLLSASSLLCVSTVHIVGSLASKLPSIIKRMHHLVRIPQSDRRRTRHCLLYNHLGFHRRQRAENGNGTSPING